ncbi:DUF4347 domain-containing protein, partial [Fastidiosibacter lacustris]|uniref:DUF4347 domain-containing protein n=1 Tax=Fastidiosibacter lacustris TaxID=2056695 RepID=UPI000E343556
NLSAVHIVSHGDVGKLYLGNEALSLDNIGDYAASLAQWGKALTDTGDILFYGCNVAEGQQGQAFVEALRSYTDADIAASIDTTASQDNGGDSILEYGQAIDNSEILHFEGYAYRLDAPAVLVGGSSFNSITQLGDNIYGENSGDLLGGSPYAGGVVSLSADGMTMAIGAEGNDGNGTYSGHVRIYSWSGTTWIQKGVDIDGEVAGERSGISVSLSANGNTVAIGAWSGNKARIYEWNGSTWIKKGGDINGEVGDDNFGFSVSLSNDGNTVAIGASHNDGTTGNASDDRGHVRIYSWNGTTWVQKGVDIDGEAAGDQSGYSVSLSADGNTVAIGAIGNDGNGSNSGHVRIYSWNSVTSTWDKLGQDIDGEVASNNSGWSVSLSADGNTVAIGAPSNSSSTGHVRIYSWNGGGWIQRGVDIDGTAAGDRFGFSVSLSNDGNTVAIGADDGVSQDKGYARIYRWNGSSWVKYGPDMQSNITNDRFGWSVALSADASKVAVGAPQNDGTTGNSTDNRGMVRVYSLIPRYTVNEDTALAINNISINDVDGNLSTVRLQANNGTLNVTLSGATISAGSNGSNDLTISGTQAEINATLASLTYQGNLDFSGSDTLTLTATDSGSSNTVQLIGITVIEKHEPILTGGVALEYSGNDGAVVIDNTISITDMDDVNLESATVSISSNYVNGGDVLSFVNVGNITGTFDVLTGILSLTGTDTLANYEAALRTVRYENLADQPTILTRTISFVVNDGDDDSEILTSTINILTPVAQLSVPLVGDISEDHLGHSVALSANGTILAVGAKDHDFNGDRSGQVKIYEWNGNGWTQKGQNLYGEASNDEFGHSVALSDDGTIVAIGAEGRNNSTGEVKIYQWNELNGSWEQLGGGILGEAEGDSSGSSVLGFSADGLTVAIGASGNDANGNGSGHVRVYHWDSTNWVKLGQDIDGQTGDGAGWSVSLSADGMTLAVGFVNANTHGQVKIYELDNNNWVQKGLDINGSAESSALGGAVSLSANGNIIAINARFGTNFTGQVKVYEWNGSSWEQRGQSFNGEVNFELLGASVSLSADGSILAFSAPNNGDSPINAGVVRLYQWNDSSWTKLKEDIYGATAGDGAYAISLSDDGSVLAIGSRNNNDNGSGAGHARVFRIASAPVNIIPGVQALNEDSTLAINGLTVRDESGILASTRLQVNNGTLTVTLSESATISAGANGSGDLTISGNANDINATLASLIYQGNLNFNGNDNLTVTSNEQGLFALSDVDIVSITVNAVNDAPTASHNTVVINEDSSHVFTASDFNFADIDGDVLDSVKITNLPTIGSLKLNGVAVTVNQVITKANIDGGLLIFTPVANGNGSNYASFDFSVNDGTIDSVSTYTMSIDVTSINDAPTAANSTIITAEDTAYTFAASDFNFADVDGDTLASITVTNLPTIGSLKLNGVAVTLNQVITKANIDGGLLIFTPVANGNGSNYASFGFKVNDGALESVSAYTMSINVTPVNDAPSISGLTTSSPYTESAADDSISPIKLVLDPSLFL